MTVDEALERLRLTAVGDLAAISDPLAQSMVVLVAELRIRLAQCETRLALLERGLISCEPLNP